MKATCFCLLGVAIVACSVSSSTAQIKWGQGISGTVKPRDDLVEYTSGGNTVRTFYADLKSGRFSGNAMVEVAGTAYIKNERGEYIANGKLELVDGSAAVRGLKGAKFQSLGRDMPSVKEAKPVRKAETRQAIVTLALDGSWLLEDENFVFLIDTSYGLRPDFAASFGRNTRLKLPPNKSLKLGDLTVSAQKKGGEVDILDGHIVAKRNVTVEQEKRK